MPKQTDTTNTPTDNGPYAKLAAKVLRLGQQMTADSARSAELRNALIASPGSLVLQTELGKVNARLDRAEISLADIAA